MAGSRAFSSRARPGVDDDVRDGAQPFLIRIGPASSADPFYDGIVLPSLSSPNPAELFLLNLDDDEKPPEADWAKLTIDRQRAGAC